ncbi:MAG: hypothetical protein WC506_03920 [Candidatus Micrarchaeia archaeon]
MDKMKLFLLIAALLAFSVMQGCIIPDLTESGNVPKEPVQAAPVPQQAAAANATVPATPQAQMPDIAFISTGMGESTLLLSDSGAVLVDAGQDPDAAAVISVLAKYQVKKISMLVITRPTAPHYAGAATIAKGFSVPWVVTNGATGNDAYKEMIVGFTKKRIIVEDAYLGWSQTVAGWEVRALNPQRVPGEIVTDAAKDSMVLQVRKGGLCAILMSDAEGSGSSSPDAGTVFGGAESKIAAMPGIEGCQILRVGAYGSGNAASLQLLNMMKPKYGIVSVGINSDGLPQEAALERMRIANMTVFRTDKQGTILAYAKNGSIEVKPMAG